MHSSIEGASFKVLPMRRTEYNWLARSCRQSQGRRDQQKSGGAGGGLTPETHTLIMHEICIMYIPLVRSLFEPCMGNLLCKIKHQKIKHFLVNLNTACTYGTMH